MILLLMGIILAYLLGAIPFGYLIAKYWAKIDIRKEGSGNIGATNALRTMGKKAGLSVLILDLLKGLIAVTLIGRLFYQYNSNIDQLTYVYVIGLTVICAHIWTIFLSFKGGKGVSTALGVLVGLTVYDVKFSLILLLAFCIWFIIVFFSKYVSLGSIAAALFLPIGLIIFIKSLEALIFGILIASIVIYSHRQNVHKLLTNTERKIKL
ncbi:MAG: glycerol-3-phosphate 1-O-acyltransferase PlsY [Candidatus Kappaea frigidicola]|nr:glycerol-3-phosphate 1-O-acyltransferase PlsY [Candidatus Kappaea frigidicola]